VITLESRHTFGSLAERIDAVARGLVRLGLRPGDRAAILLPNGLEYLEVFFGISAAGAVIVPLNTFLAPAEAATVLEDSASTFLVTTRRGLAALAPHAGRLGSITRAIVVEREEGDLRPSGGIETIPWREIVERGAGAILPPRASEDAVAILTYTSGTTGRMKGVMLTHANLLSNAAACLEAVKLISSDRLLLFLPMFHSLTQLVCMIVPPLAGLTVILLPGVDRTAIKSAVRRHRPTIFIAVPTIYAAMGEHPPGRLARWINPVRLYLSGGAPLSTEVMRRFEEGWGRPLCEGYGLSEASPVVSLNPVEGERRAGSVGKPLPGVSVRIGLDDGTEAPPGDVGEILVRGPNVMAGYHGRPDETAQALANGWLHTGDLGRLDADGYMYIVGRRKEMLIYRGMNVYPREVEEVLASHPAVSDAAVVGLPDPKRGEVPHAAVALRPGAVAAESDLRAHCRARLARYKVPRSILVMRSLPRNATGKVMKDEILSAIESARFAPTEVIPR
jgi:long-chain acyl-CoA synthetase